MAARPPYNIILAGKYGVGKTALFRYLSENTAQSVRKWDKDEHVVSLETGDVKVVLWDTANMEKNSVLSMSQSYFNECVGVIMVYKKGDLQSLMDLDGWVTRAKDASQFRNNLVFSLWCNDLESYSEDEVTPDHIRQYMEKWSVDTELHFNFSKDEEDKENVMRQYKRLVEAVREKCNCNSYTASVSVHQSSRIHNITSLPRDNTINLSPQASTTDNIQKRKCFSC